MAILAPQKSPALFVVLLKVRLLTSNLKLLASILLSALVLTACQTVPSVPAISQEPISPKQTMTSTAQSGDGDQGYYEAYSDDDYPIEPYTAPEEETSPSYPIYDDYDNALYNDNSSQPATYSSSLSPMPSDSAIETVLPPVITPPASRGDYVVPQQPTLPSHSELLERARQNSQQQSRQSTSSNSNLPAFRNLMQMGTSQLKAGNLSAAESSFTRAQRLAPRSSAVYFYLSQVALKKNQPRKAEAMARRGLTVSQDASRRRALWQLILRSGQAQNNARVIKEAQQALR